MRGFETDFSLSLIPTDAENIKEVLNEYYMYSELLLESNEYTTLQKNMFNLKTKLGRYTVNNELSSNVDYFLGKLFGMLEMQDLVLSIYCNRQSQLSAINDNDLRIIPHINDIIFNIANNEGIRHEQLAEKTHLEENNLTTIIKRLSDYNIIIFNRQGEFKCYYLSEFGRQYYNKYIMDSGE